MKKRITCLLGLLLGLATMQINFGQGWTLSSKLVQETRIVDHQFGGAVALDGSTAIIGAARDGLNNEGLNLGNSGAVDFFELDDNGNAFKRQRVVQENRAFGHSFGTSVDISGGRS